MRYRIITSAGKTKPLTATEVVRLAQKRADKLTASDIVKDENGKSSTLGEFVKMVEAARSGKAQKIQVADIPAGNQYQQDEVPDIRATPQPEPEFDEVGGDSAATPKKTKLFWKLVAVAAIGIVTFIIVAACFQYWVNRENPLGEEPRVTVQIQDVPEISAEERVAQILEDTAESMQEKEATAWTEDLVAKLLQVAYGEALVEHTFVHHDEEADEYDIRGVAYVASENQHLTWAVNKVFYDKDIRDWNFPAGNIGIWEKEE